MSKIIDLSGPLDEGLWSYNALAGFRPRLPDLAVEQVATLDRDGFEAFRFELSSLTGSYIETGRHMLAEAPLLDELSPGDFIRPAVVCHLPGKAAGEMIHGSELVAHCPPVRQGDALLIECGWASHWQTEDFVTGSPAFHQDCLPWLLYQPFSILGVDIPCIESARSRPENGEATGSMLAPIFRRGILLLAPLVNLQEVRAARGELIALPLNFRGVSGAPCRAVFREA